MMKKLIAMLIALTMVAGLAACATTTAAPEATEAPSTEATQAPAADATEAPTAAPAAFDKDIVVVSREDGSGTRGAFIELMGVEQKDADGKKVDYTTLDAEIVNSTSVVLQTVSGNVAAIGYISLGSLNDTVKALQIDGADATVENIKSGAYKVARPFNIATQATVSEAAQAFIDFILRAEGQAVIQDNKYIASVDNAPAFAGSTVAGKVVVAGSSSVTPVMEKLKEAYMALNPNAEIEIQMSDSSTGVKMAIEGNCDIGMASRELKDSELSAGVSPTVIAIDGIAIVVNNDNPISGLTAEQVRQIYVGEMLNWAEVQ